MKFEGMDYTFGHDYRQDGTCIYCGYAKQTIYKGKLHCVWVVRAYEIQKKKEQRHAKE